MSRFDKSLGNIGGNSARPCPECGKYMQADPDEFVGSRWECRNDSCPEWGTTYFDTDGVLVVAVRSVKPGDRRFCVWCQEPLSRAEAFLPWEDGSNSHAYITCPSCKQENKSSTASGRTTS